MRGSWLVVGVVAVGAVLAACAQAAPVRNESAARPAASTTAPASTTTTTPPITTTTTTTTTSTTPPPPPPPPPPKTTSTPKPKPKPAPTGGTPCTIATGACVDLSANRSWLLEGGRVIYGPVPITHGRPGWRTPTGLYRVQWKDIDHKSALFDNAPMPYSVFFNGGIAFHAGSLSQQSHGCIHLSTTAAKMYYNKLQVGEAVQVVP
jgi:lipoprotein-anchoring transpeptidase ErfK/SrfK